MDHGVSPTINERPLLFYIMYSSFLQTVFISIQALTRSATCPAFLAWTSSTVTYNPSEHQINGLGLILTVRATFALSKC